MKNSIWHDHYLHPPRRLDHWLYMLQFWWNPTARPYIKIQIRLSIEINWRKVLRRLKINGTNPKILQTAITTMQSQAGAHDFIYMLVNSSSKSHINHPAGWSELSPDAAMKTLGMKANLEDKTWWLITPGVDWLPVFYGQIEPLPNPPSIMFYGPLESRLLETFWLLERFGYTLSNMDDGSPAQMDLTPTGVLMTRGWLLASPLGGKS